MSPTSCASPDKARCSTVIGWFVNRFDWGVSILAVSVSRSLGGPQSYRSPVVVFLDRGNPCFWNLYSTVTVYVVRVKSYVNRLFDPGLVTMRITINKLYFVPKRLVSGVVSVL